jgi:hypothetical protein
MYFMMQTSNNDRPPGWKTVAIQCVASGALLSQVRSSLCRCRRLAHRAELC